MTITSFKRVDPAAPAAAVSSSPAASARRVWRGPGSDPAWIRPTLLLLLIATGALYLWNLSASGWANIYYTAAI
jgi:hypothetical protein